MDAFERYAPFIQEYIFRAGWEKLRAVQVAAADAIFNSEDNVLISASTASGKTEAAFFPVLTLLEAAAVAAEALIYAKMLDWEALPSGTAAGALARGRPFVAALLLSLLLNAASYGMGELIEILIRQI